MADMRKTFLKQHFEQNDHVRITEKIAKHVKMATSPFLFFRGSAPLFYCDFKSELLTLPKALKSIPLTTVMGDCHTSNFGFLTEEGSHGDNVIFSPNDFDDACVGYSYWDLTRFITSLFLTAEHCQSVIKSTNIEHQKWFGKKVISTDDVIIAASAFINSYLSTCQLNINEPESRSSAVEQFDDTDILYKRYLKAQQRAASNECFYSHSTLAKAVDMENMIKFSDIPDRHLRLSDHDYQEIKATFLPYVDDSILDIIERKNAGTGSVNMARYYLLIGPENAKKEQLHLCHIVEIKKQRQAALLTSFDDLFATNTLNPAHLTVKCQQRMQRNPDLILDEVLWRDAHWLVRSRHHAKVGIKPEHIGIGKKAVNGGFTSCAKSCGAALALAHCRGDRRSTAFEQLSIEILPEHSEEIINACQKYTQQVKQDCLALAELLNS